MDMTVGTVSRSAAGASSTAGCARSRANGFVPLLARVAAAAGAGLLLAPQSALAGSKPGWTSAAPARAEPFLPGIVSGSTTEESMVTVSPDGDTLFWGASRLWFPVTRVAEVRTSRYADGRWSAAVTAPFSRGFSDSDPFPARDGSGIFLSSMRPVDGPPRRDFDIWFVPKSGDSYGRATNLGRTINSDDDDLYPSVAADGTLYFASNRSGLWRIYRAAKGADGRYLAAQMLPEPVNLPGIWSFNPFISADGRTLVFTSLNRPGGFGKGDLWVARQGVAGVFETPVNLGPQVNTPEEDYHPTLTSDQRALLFIRRDTSSADGNAEAMWIATMAVPALRDLGQRPTG